MVSRAKFLAIVKLISSSLAWTSQSFGSFRTLAARREKQKEICCGLRNSATLKIRQCSSTVRSLSTSHLSVATTSPSNFLPDVWPMSVEFGVKVRFLFLTKPVGLLSWLKLRAQPSFLQQSVRRTLPGTGCTVGSAKISSLKTFAFFWGQVFI